MAGYNLVIANPPQNGVDRERAAHSLALSSEQITGKIQYPIPEIWYADTDHAAVDAVALDLKAAGCHVIVKSGDALLEVPPRAQVKSFSFMDSGLVAHLPESEVVLSYDLPVIAVFCRPRELAESTRSSGRGRRRSSMMTLRDQILDAGTSSSADPGEVQVDATPFLDIYLMTDDKPIRISVVQNAVSFSGLGRVQPRAASNMTSFVERCEDRFSHATVDRRLEGMRLRLYASRRAADSEHRYGYSYASPGLIELLPAISRDLERITQSELSARLAYLTQARSS
jgi:hypothetical protein